MRLTKPRLAPLPVDQFPDELREHTGAAPGQPILNIYGTLARHAKLTKRWLVFAAHILGKSSIDGREREILILRTGWLCKSEYEWGQHARIGLLVGLTTEEIKRIAAGPDAPGWQPFDQMLLRAADELHDDQFISDGTWNALAQRYNEQQLIDLIFTVGQYTLVSMALNTLGVQLEDGMQGFAATT